MWLTNANTTNLTKNRQPIPRNVHEGLFSPFCLWGYNLTHWYKPQRPEEGKDDIFDKTGLTANSTNYPVKLCESAPAFVIKISSRGHNLKHTVNQNSISIPTPRIWFGDKGGDQY